MLGEALSGSHPQFHFHLTENTDSCCASFTPLHLAQSTSELCSTCWPCRETQRWQHCRKGESVDFTMTPTSQSCLPSFVGYLGDGWISSAWCIVSGWLSTWACNSLKGHRSSVCFAVLGWKEKQDHCCKGKAWIGFRIGVHLRRRGWIKITLSTL